MADSQRSKPEIDFYEGDAPIELVIIDLEVGTGEEAKPGDTVEVREKSRGFKFIAASLAQVDRRAQLSWLELDKANFKGTFKGHPVRDELNEPPIREQYIVEYYSR